jgi:hypothetical protein
MASNLKRNITEEKSILEASKVLLSLARKTQNDNFLNDDRIEANESTTSSFTD